MIGLKKQISKERLLVVSPRGKALNKKSAELEKLNSELNLAISLYESTQSAIEQTRVDSIRQQRFIAMMSNPIYPEKECAPWAKASSPWGKASESVCAQRESGLRPWGKPLKTSAPRCVGGGVCGQWGMGDGLRHPGIENHFRTEQFMSNNEKDFTEFLGSDVIFNVRIFVLAEALTCEFAVGPPGAHLLAPTWWGDP